MSTDLDAKVQIFTEMVRSLAGRGRLSQATKAEMRAAFEAARQARLTPEQVYSETRANLLQASANIPMSPMSPSAAQPSPSIQLAPPVARGTTAGLSGRTPSKKPGESKADFYRRLRSHMERLGQPANQAGKAIDVAVADQQMEAAERERRYAIAKAALLANAEIKALEVQRAARARKSANTFAESADLERKARSLMRSRGQATPSATELKRLPPAVVREFTENLKQALKEIA